MSCNCNPKSHNTTETGIEVTDTAPTSYFGNGQMKYDMGYIDGKADERQRIWDYLHTESGHNGRTHYEGMNCFWCRTNIHIFEPVGNSEQLSDS